MPTNLGTAYVLIRPSTKNMQREVTGAFRGMNFSGIGDEAGQKIGQGMGTGTEKGFAGSGVGSVMSSAVSKTFKAGVIGVGAAAGGAMAGAFAKGFGRLNSLDQAEAKLKGLGFSTAEVGKAMESVNASVKGTAFGLGEAAGSAAKFTGVGVELGGELDRMMKLTADTAAQAGTNMDDVSSVLAKVAGAGKVTGETLAQLDDRAVGASGALAEHLGVSIEEVREKVSKGEIDLDTFATAMEEHIGGAAQSTGDTFKGAFDNMGAAMGRFGAKMLEPVFQNMPSVFGAVGGAFDELGKKLEPVATQFGEWLAPKMESFATETVPKIADGIVGLVDKFISMGEWIQRNSEWLGPLAVGVGTFATYLVTFTGAVAGVEKAILGARTAMTLFNGAMNANPVMLVLGAVTALIGGLIYFFTQTETGRQMWAMFTESLGAAWEAFRAKFDEVTQWVQSAWHTTVETVKAVADGMKQKIAEVTEDMVARFLSWRDNVASAIDNVKSFFDSFRQKVVDTTGQVIQNVSEIPSKIKGVFADASSWLVGKGRDIISGLWTGMQNMWENVKGWLSDLPSRIRNSIGSITFGFGGGRSNATGSFSQYVAGGIAAAEAYANGGGNLPTNAVIQRPHGKRGLVQWAENETGGEAFIPLAPGKRKRSTAILDRVAGTFGYSLVDAETGAPYQSTYRGNLGPQVVGVFADGAITGDDLDLFYKGGSVNGYRASRPLQSAPYVFGGSNWGDCSGTVSAGAGLVVGMNPFPRKFYTGDEAAWLSSHGFLRGRGGAGDFRIGFKHGGPGGGHTAATLPNGVNIEMGGYPSEGHYNTGAGAWDKYFDTFFYLPMQEQKWNDPQVTGLKDLPPEERKVVQAAVDTTAMGTSVAVQKGPSTPYEAFATTFAAEMGNRSVAQIGFDAVADFFGINPKVSRRVLFTPMDELLGVADVSQNAARGNPSTNVAEKNAVALHNEAVTTMTPAEMSKSDQLRKVADADTVSQPAVGDWGASFFAHEIARKAKTMGLDKLAAKIGIATALVESGNPLRMYANRAVPESLNFRHDALGSDYDSVGLFQQRDNGAWGTVKQRMTPFDSAGMFFAKLKSFDYQSMDPGAAAQKVQVSAFPDRYGQQMDAAERLLNKTGVFDRGGIARGIGPMWKATIEPEEVLSPEMTPLFRRFIGILPGVMDTIDTARGEMRVAYAGGDAGYGALAELFGEKVAYNLADTAFWTGGLRDELTEAFHGGDFGFASAARFFGERAGRALVDEAGWLGTAFEEVSAAWQGSDFGLAATARYLGGSERLASGLLDAVTSVGSFVGVVDTAHEELEGAFAGEDFGTGATEQLLGERRGRALAGELDWMGAAYEEVTAAARGEDFGLAATARYTGGNEDVAAQVLDGIEAAGTARETVLNLWVDPDDLLTAESISQMVNQGMDDLRMEIKGRRPAPMMMTRGGAM